MKNNLKCTESTNAIDIWQKLIENKRGIIFIVDASEKLLGSLNEKGLRDYVISRLTNQLSIRTFANSEIATGYVDDTDENLSKIAMRNGNVLPIIDKSNKLIDIFVVDENIEVPVAQPDLSGNEFKYLMDAFLSTRISSSGKYIDLFEKKFSHYCDTKHGVAVSNGTVALQLALDVLGVGHGDEVIVPDLTFAATINVVLLRNATPVIVDIEEDSWCIDPDEIEKAITPRTRAIIPVHLYGQVCNMDRIMQIAKDHGLFVIEDCAEAHGAMYDGKKVGSIGDIGCFSFYGNKVITTGEGGMCITNSDRLDEKMRVLRDHGMSKTKRYWHDFVGYNFRMTNLQAAIGVAQLERIDSILENRSIVEEKYRKALKNVSNISFQANELNKRKKITWFVCVLIDHNRDSLLKKLSEEGIDTRPFFYPLSIMPIYLPYVFSNKISVKISSMGINLPTNNKIEDHIIEKIKSILSLKSKL